MMWNGAILNKRDHWVGIYSVSILLEEVNLGPSRIVTSVYGPNESSQLSLLWSELDSIRNRWNSPWRIEGEWNVVRFPFERSGCSYLTSEMTVFYDWIKKHDLVDIQMGGGQIYLVKSPSSPLILVY